MSNLADFLGSFTGYNIEIGNYQILDDIYSSSAIILQDALTIFNIPTLSPLLAGSPFFGGSAPLPIIGLKYKTEGEVSLLEYEWAEYPYLSKQTITNAGIRQATKFQLEAYSVITGANPVAVNIYKVSSIVGLLDQYVAKGGLFTIMTLYGNITDCVLEKISGVSDGDTLEGTHLRMMFRNPNISSISSVTNQLSSAIQQIEQGGAIKI